MRPVTILLLCIALVGCEKELPVYSDKPLRRDGVLYKPNSNEPLTARVERYHENGQLEILYTAIDGKKEGLLKQWHDNGQLWSELSYVNDKREGLFKHWGLNGETGRSRCYKADKETDMSYCTQDK